MFQFQETFGAFQHHLGDLHMPVHAFVEIGMINLAVDLPLQIRYFFRALVHQK